MAFDVRMADMAWKRVCAGVEARGPDRTVKRTAWQRLSRHMRHTYSANYDGGLLRVIAFFGDSFPLMLTDSSVVFEAGPMTGEISSSPTAPTVSGRYLLLRMAEAFNEDAHLRRYIKEYANARHGSPDSRIGDTMFRELNDRLDFERGAADRRGDAEARRRLQELTDMVKALCSFPENGGSGTPERGYGRW